MKSAAFTPGNTRLVPSPSTREVAGTNRLDFDDVCTETRQHPTAEGASDATAKVEHP